tara:strand:+ start:105 stop:419 length:315 start_codon:yes stop_codon:yes gene_type:complete
MKKYNKLIFLNIALIMLGGCNTAKEAFSKKKFNNSEEFLIEKKSPLILPPSYGELPTPIEKNKSKKETKDILEIVSGEKIDKNKENVKIESSIEKLIIDNIQNN